MLKKSYRELILWMLGFTAMMIGVAFLPIEKNIGLLIRIVDNLTTAGVLVLMLLIWKTEKVFYFTGISFEEAVAAGSDRRRTYAWKHVKLFGLCAAVYLFYSLIAQFLHVSWWIDLCLIMAGLLAAGLYSNKYKL